MIRLFPQALSVLLLLAAAGCGHPKKVSHKELVAYINDPDNDLIKKEEVNGIQVRVAYRPSSLLVLQELDDGQKTDSILIKKLEKKYGGQYYFTLKISKDKKEVIRELGGFTRYSDMLQVFAFGMQERINVTTSSNDTIPVADYFFDQTYGISDGNSILVSFSKSQISDRKDIDINLAECGLGIGNLKFRFRVPDLEQVPTLDYAPGE